MNPLTPEEAVAGRANLDQSWAGARDMLSRSPVECLFGAAKMLNEEGRRAFFFDQPPKLQDTLLKLAGLALAHLLLDDPRVRGEESPYG